MIALIVAIAASLFLVVGGYRIGRLSVLGAVLGAMVLMAVAWRLTQVDTAHGEGAAAGVVIIPVILWWLVAVCLLVAAAMLVGAIRAHASLLPKVMLGVLGVVALFISGRIPDGTKPVESPSARSPGALRTAGYAWAIDRGVLADSACHGDSLYVAGCKAGVARNLP